MGKNSLPNDFFTGVLQWVPSSTKKNPNTFHRSEKKLQLFLVLVSGNACRVKFKMEYLSFWWELGAQQPVQNDRNRCIWWGE